MWYTAWLIRLFVVGLVLFLIGFGGEPSLVMVGLVMMVVGVGGWLKGKK